MLTTSFCVFALLSCIVQGGRIKQYSHQLNVAPKLEDRLATVQKYFPAAVDMDLFMESVKETLTEPDFNMNADNAIAIASLSRSEYVRPLQEQIERAFPRIYPAYGVGGMPSLGMSAVKSAMAHAPREGGKERYVFFAMTHIAIDTDGNVGQMSLAGGSVSNGNVALHDCLVALMKQNEPVDYESMNGTHQDPEINALVAKLGPRLKSSEKGDLVLVTKEVQTLAEEYLMKLINQTVNLELADYAVITGIQIHSSLPCGSSGADCPPPIEFVAPRKTFAMIGGHKRWLFMEQQRLHIVRQHFPNAMYMYDFMQQLQPRLERSDIGMHGENALAITALPRDPSVRRFQETIEQIFGPSFNAHGLAGLPNIGVAALKEAMSHAPREGGRERYVFFAMPHIAIDSDGVVGKMALPNKGSVDACGVLKACLGELKKHGLQRGARALANEALDPEFHALLTKLIPRLQEAGTEPSDLDLVSLTQEVQKLVESELLKLIAATVDKTRADYVVVTGVLIHSSVPHAIVEETPPTLEFIALGKSYAVVRGRTRQLGIHGPSSSDLSCCVQ